MKCKEDCPICKGKGEYQTFIRTGFLREYIEARTLPCPNPERHKELIILEGIEQGNRFFSMNTPEEDGRFLADGRLVYKILGYADTTDEAQLKLYGSTYPLDGRERKVDLSMIIA